MKHIARHPLVKAWAKYVKKEGGCIQCQHPWYDGLCDCEFRNLYESLVYEIEGMVNDIITNHSDEWKY